MFKWLSKKRNKKGFTLVELVVVVAILGILAAVAVPKFTNSRENAAIAAHEANIRTLYSAANMAIAENGNPAVGIPDWEAVAADEDFDSTKYLQEWPKVPVGAKVKDDKDVEVTYDSDSIYNVEINADGTIVITVE